jgi:hypothetical protein
VIRTVHDGVGKRAAPRIGSREGNGLSGVLIRAHGLIIGYRKVLMVLLMGVIIGVPMVVLMVVLMEGTVRSTYRRGRSHNGAADESKDNEHTNEDEPLDGLWILPVLSSLGELGMLCVLWSLTRCPRLHNTHDVLPGGLLAARRTPDSERDPLLGSALLAERGRSSSIPK